MMGITHMLTGIGVGLLVATSTDASLEAATLLIGAGALGGLLPDIDHPQSTISRKAGVLRWLIFWIPHRTLTHSLIALVAAAVVGILLGLPGWVFAAGYAAHVAADMMTYSGVPVLYPFTRRRFHLLPGLLQMQTGGFAEMMICAALFAAVLIGGLQLAVDSLPMLGLIP